MRTQREILDRIESDEADDMFDVQKSDLVDYLDFDNAKPYLNSDYIKQVESGEEKWHEPKSPAENIKDYMPFAWEKANNKRGLSAARSLCHMKTWLWLDGYDELSESILDYEYYGKPQLIEICRLYGLDSDQWDDGIRENE